MSFEMTLWVNTNVVVDGYEIWDAAVVPPFSEGSTYSPDYTRGELNVTGNYYRVFDFDVLNGKSGQETIQILEKGIRKLGAVRSDNYWKPTPGNVGYCLSILLGWARMHPAGVWTNHCDIDIYDLQGIPNPFEGKGWYVIYPLMDENDGKIRGWACDDFGAQSLVVAKWKVGDDPKYKLYSDEEPLVEGVCIDDRYSHDVCDMERMYAAKYNGTEFKWDEYEDE